MIRTLQFAVKINQSGFILTLHMTRLYNIVNFVTTSFQASFLSFLAVGSGESLNLQQLKIRI